MTELQLYKFIVDNNIEWDWRGNDLYIWISPYDVPEFVDMLGSYCDVDPLNVVITGGGYICVPTMVEICDWFGIEIENIFEKQK